MRRIEVLSAALLAVSVCALGASGAGQAQAHDVALDALDPLDADGAASELARALSGPPEGSLTPYDVAYEACVDKEEGMACRVAFDRLQFDGSCVLALDQRLICLPDESPTDR